jgi:hypothetical protein
MTENALNPQPKEQYRINKQRVTLSPEEEKLFNEEFDKLVAAQPKEIAEVLEQGRAQAKEAVRVGKEWERSLKEFDKMFMKRVIDRIIKTQNIQTREST